MVQGRIRRTWWGSALCALAAICFALVSLVIVPPASSDSSVSQLNAVANAGEVSAQAGESVDYTPKLFQMLANNNRIDTYGDELRMDFVLRVAHNQVDPANPQQCATAVSSAEAKNRSCGLRLYFDFGADATGGTTPINYIDTLSPGKAGMFGAILWAYNNAQVYTIHSIITSGVYDFLNISVECDINYPNDVDPKVLGGVKMDQYVYAVVQKHNTGNGKWEWPGTPNNAASRQESDFLTNVAKNNPAYVYKGSCSGNDPSQCNGPISFIGWDGSPALWSGNQANWGLVTDYGLNLTGLSVPLWREGLAPPNSFFVFWANPADNNNPCSLNTSFYFQWLALKGGKDWVPVDDLTPQAQLVTGQQQQRSGASSANGQATAKAAVNLPKTLLRSNPELMGKQGPGGSLSPAQEATGAIDFAKAKDDQGLDGYFKLVTWPVTTDKDGNDAQCVAPGAMRDTYNPLSGGNEAGVTKTMSQDQINALVDKGWTIDTAYYKYSLPKPVAPVIDTPAENAIVVKHPTITGTGTPGHKVSLYAEDTQKPIDANDVDNADTRGRLVGTAIVGEDGTWSVVDNDNTIVEGSQRYHAWQTELASGYELTSPFSNIRTLKFAPSTIDSAAITVPHTKRTSNGELPTGSKVHISGTAAPATAGQNLTLYATHTVSAGGATTGVEKPVTGCSMTLASAGEQNWSCEIDPSFFLDEVAQGDTYIFTAQVTNPEDNSKVRSAGVYATLDMTSTQLAVDSKPAKGTVSGTARHLKTGLTADTGAKVTVTWPSNATESVTVGADGRWSFNIPEGLTQGEARITADDHPSELNDNNEAGWVTYSLAVSQPVPVLPMTGDRSHLIGLIFAVVGALLTIGIGMFVSIECFIRRGKAVDDS
ncbi:hypothetical protein [Bifidobacterium sp. ESL0704]|uniref:hypothetical protein n=1 Tax=Bifidobacterium sp. ESL0704 TaxID=2983219 RepID=UPI0023F6D72E|nr:hypothetical protein [Bifidobacterium sp. ESL0704]WEV53495.1 hypothetical protein OZX64_03230 [Bifidobacterium sp. ESL0704]